MRSRRPIVWINFVNASACECVPGEQDQSDALAMFAEQFA
jgi:hypothetical protein